MKDQYKLVLLNNSTLKGVGIWQTSPPVSGVGLNRTKPGSPILAVTVRMGFYRGLTASWRFESSPFSTSPGYGRDFLLLIL